MSHGFLSDVEFWDFLAAIDRSLSHETRLAGCSECAGKLHSARYFRRSRGGPWALHVRHSFCCATDGCRRRRLPPSVLFLGRKVFLGAVVVLASVLRHGLTEARAERLTAVLGVSRRTLIRWRAWWLRDFAESRFWRSAVGRLGGSVERARLPASLVERFQGDAETRMCFALRLLAPVSSSEGLSALAR